MKSVKFPPCLVCDEPMVWVFQMRVMPCRHVAHQWCRGECSACVAPPPNVLMRFLTLTWLGVMGDAHAKAGQHRRSVMMATTLGFLWAAQPLVIVLRLGFPHVDFWAFFLIFVYLWYPFVGETTASCLALWIAGRFEVMGSTYGFLTRFSVDVGTCVAATGAFRLSDVSGSLVVFAYVFGRVWRMPSMWDVHLGNCCGAGSLTLGVFGVCLLTALLVSGLTHETFDGVGPLHAAAICGAAFRPQTADPFTPLISARIREVAWFVFVAFLVLGSSHNS